MIGLLLLFVISISAADAEHTTFTFSVNDAVTRTPISDATVMLYDNLPGFSASYFRYSVQTDHRGLCTVEVASGQLSSAKRLYVISVQHEAYAPFAYGQKGFNLAGRPIASEPGKEKRVEIFLHKFGAVAGWVTEPGGSAAANVRVLAYRLSDTVTIVGENTTDDRGHYRIAGIAPGRYDVRTAPTLRKNARIGLLPSPPMANPVVVDLDHEVRVDLAPQFSNEVKPLRGIAGLVTGQVTPKSVQLHSEFGTVSARVGEGNRFFFAGLTDGEYEITTAVETGTGLATGYAKVELRGVAVEDLRLQVDPPPYQPAELIVEDDDAVELNKYTTPLLYASWEPPGTLPIYSPNVGIEVRDPRILYGQAFTPGYWQVQVVPWPGTYCAAELMAAPPARVDGWKVFVPSGSLSKVTVSLHSKSGSLAGTVRSDGRPQAAAPVFLGALDPPQSTPLLATRTDENGRFHFGDLAPGQYRLVSSYDLDASRDYSWKLAHAITVRIERGSKMVRDVVLQ